MVQLNKNLLKKQKVTEDQQENIRLLHEKLKSKFALLEILIEQNKLTKDEAIRQANEVKKIEFQLQDNWNFERDENRHKYWYTIPGCTCPTMDNSERWGTPYHIVNNNCPYHGEGENQ